MIARLYVAVLVVVAMMPTAAFALDSASVEIMPPVPKSISGGPDPIQAGKQTIIAADIRNNDEETTSFVVVYDFRNSDGFTTQLSLVNGTIDAGKEIATGIIWTPQQAGEYSVHAFVLTDIGHPVPISPVVQSRITAEEPVN